MHKFWGILLAGAVSFGSGLSTMAFSETKDLKAEERISRLSDELALAFNLQIKNELDGANIYLAMSHHFYLKSLDGFGFWFTQQYYEELNHARILMDFLKRKNAKVEIAAIEATKALSAESADLLVTESLVLEELQTQRIQTLHAKAQQLGSVDSAIFLQWFINEQVQEEDMFQNLVDRLDLVAGVPEGLLAIDKDLGARLPAVIWQPGQPLP